jgi:hypothetical protein
MALNSYTCELCLRQCEETLGHLFLRCSFAKQCWMLIGVIVSDWLGPERATRHVKISLGVPFAMEIIIIMPWCIWKERNAWIFNNEDPSVNHCKIMFKKEYAMVIHRAKSRKVDDMKSWLHNLGRCCFFFLFFV